MAVLAAINLFTKYFTFQIFFYKISIPLLIIKINVYPNILHTCCYSSRATILHSSIHIIHSFFINLTSITYILHQYLYTTIQTKRFFSVKPTTLNYCYHLCSSITFITSRTMHRTHHSSESALSRQIAHIRIRAGVCVCYATLPRHTYKSAQRAR